MNNKVTPLKQKAAQTVSDEIQQNVGTAFNFSQSPLRHKNDQSSSVDAEIEATAIPDLNLHRVQNMGTRELETLQAILEHGKTLGRWQTPLKWAGGLQPSMQDISLRQRIVDHLEERHKVSLQDDGSVRSCVESVAHDTIRLDAVNSARIDAILDGAVIVATRYLLLCRMGPSALGRYKGRTLDTTTIANIAYQYLAPLFAIGVGKWIDNQTFLLRPSCVTPTAISYLALVCPEDLERFSKRQQKQMKLEIERARMLAEIDMWTDVPFWETPLAPVTIVRGEPRRRQQLPKPVDKHLPLPDSYVAEMGSKSLWIIRELGPNLLVIAEQFLQIWESTDDLAISPGGVEQRRNSEVVKYLQCYAWRDSTGSQIACPPFGIRLWTNTFHIDRESSPEPALEPCLTAVEQENDYVSMHSSEIDVEPVELLEWPPRNFRHIVGLMATLQCAHLFVAAMSTASRRMELVSFERDCVVRARDGTTFARGRTFKLVERHEGVLRDWILPEIAVDAIEQQTRLANLAELIGPQEPERTSDNRPVPPPEGGAHLWVQNGLGRGDRTKPLTNVNHALITYASTLGMSTRPGGQKMRSHRFRKTVARLAALALTDAPMILMQVFGHKSVEMTLYYILTDKDLQIEVETVRRELKIMRGVTVVDSLAAAAAAMTGAAQETREVIAKASGEPSASPARGSAVRLPYAGYGGPAAPKLFEAVKERVMSMHRTGREWGASDSYETAYFLTEAGITFTMPRDGVFCTKGFTQPAACTGKRGKTNPGNCQADCGHRLELASRRSQLDTSLARLVALYEEAVGEGHGLLAAGLAKKVREALLPFEDIREKWMDHTTVRAIVAAAEQVPA